MKKMPDLRGLKVDEAKELLRKKSIKYDDETKKIFSLTVGNGKIVKTEEENKKLVLYESNRKFFLFILLGTITVVSALALSITYGTGIFNSVKEQIIEITGIITAPELEAAPGWGKEKVINVIKDAKGSKEIDHYEYCIKKNKDEECTWQETYTKNAIVSKTGTWHVIFRGVDIDGKKGRESTIIVFVDNEAPDIKEFKVEKEDETTVTVKTTAKDKDSGLVKIMYSLDGINYTEGKEEYTYEGLIPGEEYTLYVKAIDQVGNEKVVNLKLIKKTKEEIELEKVEEKETKESEKEWDTPQVDLKKLPSVFTYGEKYNLPSSYNFGNDTGTVVCKVDGKEYTDTSELSVGKKLIECIATSNHGKTAKVEKEVEIEVVKGPDEKFDGWIRLNLYYPDETTDWEWRLDGVNGIRTGYKSDSWQPYTGPILIKIEDTGNVFIRYKVKGETVIVSPRGKVTVDIEPVEWTLNEGKTTKVKINYDKDAKTKKYRINGGSWQDYQDEFEVEANTLIEAKATKEEKVYDSEGEYQYTKNITGTDTAYISQYVKPGESAPVGPGGVPVESVYEETPTNPGEQVIPIRPGRTEPAPGTPAPIELVGPIISSNPSTEIVEETTVTITPQQEAYRIYYRINDGSYRVYTEPFKVKNNCEIYAYYVSKDEGQTSLTSGYRVSNIKERNLPYVLISANPDYLSQSISETTVTISGNDYTKLEYSLDDVVYQEYTGPLTITESKTVYARGTNQYGQKKESLSITTINPPKVEEREDLTVNIEVNPEGSDELIAYTDVTITFDKKAENKYYSIDGGYNFQEYTGPFRVTNNTTVVGYATSKNGSGRAVKVIDFLSTGIANPLINLYPSGTIETYNVTVEITYDRNATEKKYKIGSNEWQDYTEPFEVTENTTISAYNKNILNEEATSSISIRNIGTEPKYTALDLGDYYQFKLNFPDISNGESREYKWKENGTWKKYTEPGILLIKQEKKDKYDLTVDGIEIEDNKGNKIRIDMEHVYVLDCPASELAENLFMRWDTVKPKTPEVNLSTTEATKEVEVTIVYEKRLIEKEYKIVYADGTETDWQEYTGSFKINKNNATIYAKGKDRSDLKTDIASKKITNIDEEAPVISINGDFETPKRSVPVQINAKDNLLMYMVKWEQGHHNEDYFNEEKEDNGRSIKNGSTVTFTENGIYTIYAVDSVGNETLKEIEITNIDLTAPDIKITVLTSGIATQARISIDYGDSEVKEYSIGDNQNYQTYTDELLISAYDYYTKANEDGSLTIYVKGTDEAGNVEEVSENLYCLDLDMIAAPTIVELLDYPTLSKDGFEVLNKVSVTYANRNDIVNEISLDNGATWQRYKNALDIEVPVTVKARSRKNISGLTVESTKTIDAKPSALTNEAFDGNNETELTINANEKASFKVVNDGQTKKITIRSNAASGSKVNIYGTDGSLNKEVNISETTQAVTLPSGTTQVELQAGTTPLKVAEIVINGIIKTVDGESLLSILQNNNNLKEEYYIFKVGNEFYPVHLYVLDGNQTITENTTYGDSYDVGTSNSYAENMVIVKVNGDYTVNEGVTVAPYSTKYGGPKGFFLYVTGKLTNNGTIDNSHGAYAQGQDVILWKNADGTYETVPALGGLGGVSNSTTQALGTDGIGRQTGGGSSGGTNSGSGSNGTSYSGGTGGGLNYQIRGYDGRSDGGPGGDGYYAGAGNPGGTSPYTTEWNGKNGTGGLLIIYSNEYLNQGTISANGAQGASSAGSSGGGSINIFTNQSTGIDGLGYYTDVKYKSILGTAIVNGPYATNGTHGKSGNGTVNIGEIRNGTYYDLVDIIDQDKIAFENSITLSGDSILSIMNNNDDLDNGYYIFNVNDEKYSVHLINENNDTISTSTTYGSESDISDGVHYASNMVIVKRNGNLTINSGVTIAPVSTKYGGPKGFMLYVTGTLTNNGTIDNSHGAYAEGQNVYLWKNSDGTYEYVPAVGALGGVPSGMDYAQGQNGTGRQTGGGASGGGFNGVKGGIGSNGTSYSGGSGGGTAYSGYNPTNASPNGGKGGNGIYGGAGNPGGTGWIEAEGHYGTNGTGGLLIIYANNYHNQGTISANGGKGGGNGGPSSGGGSINIFYNTKTSDGTVSAIGPYSKLNNSYGKGGNGTVTYTQIDVSSLNSVTPQALRNAKSIMSANTVADSISEDVVNPIVTIETNENTKVISIEKDETYKTEYSLDYGTTWVEYTEAFEVLENTVIFTRVVDNEGNILSSSTYTITSIKEKEEVKEESTEVLPSETTPEIVEDGTKPEEKNEGGELDETNE